MNLKVALAVLIILCGLAFAAGWASKPAVVTPAPPLPSEVITV